MKEQGKKRRPGMVRIVILAVLAVIIAVSGAQVYREYAETKRQQEEQERLAALASREPETEAETEPETEAETEPETEAPYVSPVDFDALLQENPDVVGWITVPNTKIDYPIVWKEGDNEYYLHRDFDGSESVYGTIYLDSDSEPDFSGWNHPIYGHHMKDGSMFRDVVKFKEPEFFAENRYFTIYTPEREIRLKTLACYYSDPDGIIRKTKFKTTDTFNEWVKERLAPCSFAEYPETPIDNMVVLVTCSYERTNVRTLLYAAEVDENDQFIPADEERDREKPGSVMAELASQTGESAAETK